MRFLRLLPALLLALTVTACDTTTGPEEEPPPEEELGPVTIEYRISAPADIQDFAIEYTNGEGMTVLVPAGERVMFPFTPPAFEVEADVAGTFRASISGSASSGGVQVVVTATQDGLIRETQADDDQAAGPNDPVAAEAAIELPLPIIVE